MPVGRIKRPPRRRAKDSRGFMGIDVLDQQRTAAAPPVRDLKQTLKRGLAHHQAGEWALAFKCYQAVLAVDPEQADALNLTGVLAHQMGDHRLAVALLERAAVLDPRAPDFAINLGLALQAGGDLERALASFDRAVLLRPAAPTAHLHLGTVRRLLGDLAGSLAAYDRALALDPELAEAHATRGAALHSLGRLAEGERALRRAIELKPAFAEAYSDLGSLLQAAGRSDEAIAAYRDAIRLKPDLADAHANLGTALAAAGDSAGAVDSYRRALAAAPSHYEALINLGAALQAGGRLPEAIAAFDAARVVRPGAREPYLRLGTLHHAEGRAAESLAVFEAGLERVGRDADLLSGKAGALKQLDRLTEAVAAYRDAVALQPGSARLLANLGNALHAAGFLDDAALNIRRAIAIDPDLAEARLTLGNILKAQGDVAEAAASYRDALRLKATFAEAEFNLGNLWRDNGRYPEALAAYDRALAIRPEYGDARWNRALALIGAGELARGFDEYEWRFRQGDRLEPPTLPGGPLWTGEPVAGKRVLVWREQGLGDEVLFLTALPDLIAAGARAIVVVSPRLVGMTRRAFPDAQVIGSEPGALDGIDYDLQVPMGSLPRWFRRSRSAFGNPGPLFRPLEAERTKWQARLAALPPGKRVGICWRSGLMTAVRSRNYAGWDRWLPVLRLPGITWVNLQYDECGAEIAEAAAGGVTIHRWEGDDLRNDLESVLGLTAALDAVVTAPTAVSSFAGAVGAPTVQLDSGSDWTTFGEDRSPWLPSLRLVRKGFGEASWDPALDRLAGRLAAWVAGREAAP